LQEQEFDENEFQNILVGSFYGGFGVWATTCMHPDF